MKIIDLSHSFTPSMPTYPGDPTTEMQQVADIHTHGFSDTMVKTTMHVGTHIDAPSHMIEGGKQIDEIELKKFIGRGILIDARKINNTKIEKLEDYKMSEDDIVLLYTGWDKKYRTPEYYQNFPQISIELAQFFIEKKVKMVGMDFPSPDWEPFPIHKMLLKEEILIVENLTNLESLLPIKNFDIVALPIKFAADGALSRVIAIAQ